MKIKEVIERICWMLKVKDCYHNCIMCEHYKICRLTGTGEKEHEHEVCKKK